MRQPSQRRRVSVLLLSAVALFPFITSGRAEAQSKDPWCEHVVSFGRVASALETDDSDVPSDFRQGAIKAATALPVAYAKLASGSKSSEIRAAAPKIKKLTASFLASFLKSLKKTKSDQQAHTVAQTWNETEEERFNKHMSSMNPLLKRLSQEVVTRCGILGADDSSSDDTQS
jgi:hypothetical protein